MSTMTKVFVVLTAVLSIALSCLFIAAAAQWVNWRELGETYQEQAAAAVQERIHLQTIMEAQVAMLQDSIQEKARLLDAAQQEKKDLASELAETKTELARRTNEAVAAEASRKKLEEIVNANNAERTALQKQNEELLRETIDLQTRNTRLNSRVLELQSEKTILTEQVRNMNEKLYACQQQLAAAQRGGGGEAGQPAARVTGGGQGPAGVSGAVAAQPRVAGPIRGEITDVSGNYANINVGSASGVQSGMTFMVHRGSEFVAELVIDRVSPQQAAGKLKTLQRDVQRGDAVSYGLENIGS